MQVRSVGVLHKLSLWTTKLISGREIVKYIYYPMSRLYREGSSSGSPSKAVNFRLGSIFHRKRGRLAAKEPRIL